MPRKVPKKFFYVLVACVPLILLMAKPPFLNNKKLAVVEPASGPLGILTWPIRELKKIVYYQQTYSEYVKLKREVDGLRAKLVNAQELLRENKRLGDLLDFKKNLPYQTIAAGVVGRDPSHWNALLIVDKGEAQGVEVGMPVVNTAGVVGKIVETGEQLSKVILVTDPNFSVAVVTQDSRESGLLTGSLQGLCRLKYLPQDAVVNVGEKIITSRLSSTFPDGILIGTVLSVHRRTNTTGTECIVLPAIMPSRIEEVLILKR